MSSKKTLKSLILVESSGKARSIKKLVGSQYTVISTDGFLKDLPKSRIGVDIEQNFLPDYITVRGKGSLMKELKKETFEARRIFFATNPDPAGEFLANQCCELFGVNPNSRCRMIFDEVTKSSVKNSLTNAVSINKKLVEAFQTRQIIDKVVSHQIGEYLSCKIYRGIKVGRFRAMLLNLIKGLQPDGNFTLGKNLTPAVLQELALKDLNFSASKTRILLEQLYEGLNFDKEGFCGIIKFPHGGEISLTSEKRSPEIVKPYLTDSQFKLYNLIWERVSAGEINETFELDGTCNDFSLMAALDTLKIDWAEYYSVGIGSLLKRNYVESADGIYKVTELGKKVIDALSGFFDEVFNTDSYKKVSSQISEIVEGKAEKISVIKNYCDEFGEAFKSAMDSLGENATPQDEPAIETDEICEKCGRKMLLKRGRYGRFLACSGYPECKNAKPYLDYTEYKCPKCGSRLAKRMIRGKTFYSCEKFPTCDFSTWDEPQTKPCKVCGAVMLVHRFKDRAPMIYCGNENCSTRKDHPMNKILEEARRRYELRKRRKEELAAKKIAKAGS